MTDIARVGFGPTRWICSECGEENKMSRSHCSGCGREPRKTLSDGTQIYPGHRELRSDGQQKGCRTETTMGQALAETYARDPYFYSGTFCCGCGKHFPVGADGEFVWTGTEEKVGT